MTPLRPTWDWSYSKGIGGDVIAGLTVERHPRHAQILTMEGIASRNGATFKLPYRDEDADRWIVAFTFPSGSVRTDERSSETLCEALVRAGLADAATRRWKVTEEETTPPPPVPGFWTRLRMAWLVLRGIAREVTVCPSGLRPLPPPFTEGET